MTDFDDEKLKPGWLTREMESAEQEMKGDLELAADPYVIDKLRADLAAVTAQRDAAVEALRKIHLLSMDETAVKRASKALASLSTEGDSHAG